MPLVECEVPDFENATDVRRELHRFDTENLWSVIFECLKNRSTILNNEACCEAARDIRNRSKNRYRDISPYDDTRVHLASLADGDYINASYVEVPDVPARRYILTQGPMELTVSHFWLMVWEHRSPSIIMLNHIYEKGTMRCYPYFPHQEGPSFLTFMDVDLRVHLEEETSTELLVKRLFKITHLKNNEHHRVVHLHYTNWPDFGVPSSSSGMLNFLWAVRSTGTLSDPEHPAIVHCSAGVGRSGAFVLIDLALYLVETRGSLNGLNLSRLFLDLRRCRMGVIQTAEQLRFCYSAIVRGADEILNTPADKIPFIEFEPLPSEVEQSADSDTSDDGWGGLEEGDYSSSTDFDAMEDEELELEGEMEEQAEGTAEAAVTGNNANLDHLTNSDLRKRFVTNTPGAARNRSKYVVTGNWLPVGEEADANRLTSSVGVGPGSVEPFSFLRVRNVQGGHSVDQRLSPRTSGQFSWSSVRDRSNNAIPPTLLDESTAPVQRNASLSISPLTSPHESLSEISEFTGIVSKPDGDNVPPDGHDQPSASEPPEPSAVLERESLDPETAEYFAAAYDLQRRREARRRRQARLREHVEQTRRRMREADLERKRWIPTSVLRLLRRFFAESGLVQSCNGAVLSVSAFVLLTAAAAGYAYKYWPQ